MVLESLSTLHGAIAQLGERLNGIQEVSGSIPLSSTNNLKLLSKNCAKLDRQSKKPVLLVILFVQDKEARWAFLFLLLNCKIKSYGLSIAFTICSKSSLSACCASSCKRF